MCCAPELATDVAGDGRADLYSLEAILYEMLTGQRSAMTAPGRRPSRLRPDLPPEADHLVTR
jgi:hypothetical protein